MVTLRSLTTEDAGTLEQIHAACFPDGWSCETFCQLLEEPVTCGWLAISHDKAPIGFILARVVRDEAEILTFAVHPSLQRAGVGQTLLEALITFLQSVHCPRIFLEVAIDNEAAIRLYAAIGFKVVGTRPHYYQRAPQTFISAIVMVYEGALESHKISLDLKKI